MEYIRNKAEKILSSGLIVFCFLWAVVFILYLPAARSGMEGDFPYWILSIKNNNFWDYVNTKSASGPSLYQFTQVAMYCIYKLFGLNVWLWHLLHITLHTFVCLLLFKMSSKLFTDAGIRHSFIIAFAGVFLFCIAPHASEVIVREPCYHYLQGFIFILVILICVQQFIATQKVRYAWIAGITYLMSIFSLEIFYLTPLFVFLLAACYLLVLQCDKTIFRRTLVLFFLPQLLLFVFHLALMRVMWGNKIAHIGALNFDNPVILFSKPIRYLFHILFLGRYFPLSLKQKIYLLCESKIAVYTFYSAITLFSLFIIVFFRKINRKGKIIFMFSLFSLLSVFELIPLDFTDALYIIGDRYCYMPSAFIYMVFVLAVSFISYRPFEIMVYSAYLLANLYFTHRINKYWHYSAEITKKLLTNIPAVPKKTILLLNLPGNMNGALMIRTHTPSEFKLMNNLFIKENKVTNEVYDVCAYNMQQSGDGAHVVVLNDSVIHVTLNQWGSWWWNGDLGAISYENELYKLNMVDAGHWYELTLKYPAQEYLLLYEVGDQWKVVDWSRKNVDQD